MAEAIAEKPVDVLDEPADAKVEALAGDASIDANGGEPSSQQPRGRQNLYFVRVPRPQIDDAPIKELQIKLSATLGKLKEYNGKLAAKREVVQGLRGQVAVARSLKEEAAPEWQDKISKLGELKDIRKSYQDQIAALKALQSGLDVRTEEELDAKVAAMEAEISHGRLELREEKQMVRDISRLKAQRDRVRQSEAQKGQLTQLEGELAKVKATIKELDTEVSALRGERSQAVGILQEIQGKLREANEAIGELEGERAEHEAKKKALQEQIRTAQDESSVAMQEWRENRKFSLTVRDLVEAGKLEEAKAMCEEQVATYMTRLLSDSAYRKEYTQGWSEQRKYLVSELLPGSGVPQEDSRGPRDKGPAGRGGKGDKAAAPRPEPKVQGAAKAAALIEQLMQQAQATVAAQRGSQPQPEIEEEEEAVAEVAADADGGAPDANGDAHKPPSAAVGPREVPGATEELLSVPKKAKSKVAGISGSSTALKQVVELPKVADEEFEVPVVAKEGAAADEGLTEEQKKELIREENRRKAAEAEARKKRHKEAAVRKKQLAEARKAEEPLAPAPAPAPVPEPAAESGAAEGGADDAATAPAPAKQQQQKVQKVQQRKPKGAAVIKPEPMIKRPRGEDPVWRKVLKTVGLDDQTNQAVAICIVILLLILIISMTGGRRDVVAAGVEA